jgi:hypothetical protein
MKRGLKVLGVVGALAISACTGYALDQPHMQNALNALQAARSELQVAEADKGGHRAAAIGLVNQAIVQVQEGIAYAGG